MTHKKLFFPLVLLLLMAINSCSWFSLLDENSPLAGDNNYYITGYVYDYYSNVPLADVAVKAVRCDFFSNEYSDNYTGTTDATGKYKVAVKLQNSQQYYNVYFSKPGYYTEVLRNMDKVMVLNHLEEVPNAYLSHQ